MVDYGLLYETRYPLLRLAVERFLSGDQEGFGAFCEKNAGWLEDYALFMAIKGKNGGVS